MKKSFIKLTALVLVLAAVFSLSACTWFGNNYIGKPAAKAAALADMGVAENEVSGLRCDLEKESGYAYYEVEFVHSAVEYDYYIDALTGAVKNVTSESVFD